MALTIASGGTRDGTNACHVGPFKAKANPWPNVRAMTANSVAWCSQASVASVAASSIMKVWVTRRIRFRSSRSVYTPPIGESTVGMKFTNVTKDTQKAEWVSRKTNQERAIACIHVPTLESRAPTNSNRKFRWRSASNEPT